MEENWRKVCHILLPNSQAVAPTFSEEKKILLMIERNIYHKKPSMVPITLTPVSIVAIMHPYQFPLPPINPPSLVFLKAYMTPFDTSSLPSFTLEFDGPLYPQVAYPQMPPPRKGEGGANNNWELHKYSAIIIIREVTIFTVYFTVQ
jgi:hypothetical protein